MSAAITLTSANEVINGGIVRPVPTPSRFDAQLLAPQVAVAEERFLVPVLCRAFYEDLIAQKTTDTSNYNTAIGPVVPKFGGNADYEYLWVNYLAEVAARAVFYCSIPTIGIQTGSNGVYLNGTTYGESAGVAGMKYLQDNQLQYIDLTIKRMKRYLCENYTLFPLWPVDKFCKDCGCSCDDDCDCTTKKPKEGGIDKVNGIILY
jgi:hypothetical protein